MTKQELQKYLEPSKTVDINKQITQSAKEIQITLPKEQQGNIPSLVFAIRKWINKHTDSEYKAKTLLESRFTPATQLIKRPMASCGAVATLANAMLRSLGHPTRLVHGNYDREDVDQHAWIEVYNQKVEEWIPFDLTGLGGPEAQPGSKHIRKLDCMDWADITEMLEQEHLETQERLKIPGEFWNRAYAREPKTYYQPAKLVLDITMKVLKESKQTPQKVLDIGCGEGKLAEYFIAQGCDVTGVDASSIAIERARINVPKAKFVVADFMSWKPDERYDLVVCNLVLAFIKDRPTFFAKVAELTQFGAGLLLITQAWLDNTSFKPKEGSKDAQISTPYFDSLIYARGAFSHVYEVDRSIRPDSMVHQIIFATNNTKIPKFSTDWYFNID